MKKERKKRKERTKKERKKEKRKKERKKERRKEAKTLCSDMECYARAPGVGLHHARQRLAWSPPGINPSPPGIQSMSTHRWYARRCMVYILHINRS